MKKLVYILLFLSLNAFGQPTKATSTNHTTIDRFIQRGNNHQNEDSAFFYLKQAFVLSQNIDYVKGQENACKGLINLFKNDEIIDNRLRYTLALVDIYEANGSDSDKLNGYLQLGQLYYGKRLYKNAAEFFEMGFNLTGLTSPEKYKAGVALTRSLKFDNEIDKALLAARKTQFLENLTAKQQIDLHIEKAEIYHGLLAYNEELESYQNIIELAQSANTPELVPSTWNNIGYVHKYLGEVADAKRAFQKTIQISKSNDEHLKATAQYNLGLIYHNHNQIDSALIHFKNAEQGYMHIKDFPSVATSYNMQAMSYYHDDDIFNAQKKLNSAFTIEKEHNLKKEEAKSHEIQSLFHQDQYDYEQALISYKRFLSIRDSLLAIERTKNYLLVFDKDNLRQKRLQWVSEDLETANLAKERAQLDAEQERIGRQLKEQELQIVNFQNKQLQDREALKELQLREERLNNENKQKKLELVEQDNKLKVIALEKERLVVSENQKEIRLLEQKNKLEQQRRTIKEQEFKNKVRLFVGILSFVLIILLFILFAYRQLRKRKKQIEAQNIIIEESKKEIEIEKEKSDNLLLNILPDSVAEELKLTGSARPKSFKEVSVGFTDFSGFTMISEQLSAEELVDKLDQMFLEFDKIIENHGLQRIKTIGDAYMFAGGIPEQVNNHALESVKAALEMRDFINEFNIGLPQNAPKWNIRIGVHTGPVVAGVIGIKKFAYDIWGDTVNTAARMESSGEIGKVNISGGTYNLVKDFFKTEHRGKVKAKNKGEIHMYFVERK